VKTKTIHPQNTSTPKNLPLKPATSEDPELHRRIALKAYELFAQRGYRHGHDTQDWLEAERLILSERVPFPMQPSGRA
jgi:hypothetical protein